ncbi:MAG TPA: hypothetical protein VD997_01830 [Phycisphaerales bacterium]|nr:hypothetical protein [Phycisphaerales bacterium]
MLVSLSSKVGRKPGGLTMGCKCKSVAVMALGAVGLIGAGAVVGLAGGCSSASSRSEMGAVNDERPDCPGKIVCPLTGETICADQCPARKAN